MEMTSIDFHVHSPVEPYYLKHKKQAVKTLENMIKSASENGLRHIVLVDRESEANRSGYSLFKEISLGNVIDSEYILSSNEHEITIQLQGQKQPIKLVYGMEMEVNVGHMLAIHKAEPGQPLDINEYLTGFRKAEETLEIVLDKDDGIACANHPEIAGGMSLNDIKLLNEEFSGKPFVVEINAQIPDFFGKNQKTKEFAEKNNMVAIGNSDLHPLPGKKHYELGTLFHTLVPKDMMENNQDFYQNIKNIILNHSDEIKVEGKASSLYKVALMKVKHLRWDIPNAIRNRKKNF